MGPLLQTHCRLLIRLVARPYSYNQMWVLQVAHFQLLFNLCEWYLKLSPVKDPALGILTGQSNFLVIQNYLLIDPFLRILIIVASVIWVFALCSAYLLLLFLPDNRYTPYLAAKLNGQLHILHLLGYFNTVSCLLQYLLSASSLGVSHVVVALALVSSTCLEYLMTLWYCTNPFDKQNHLSATRSTYPLLQMLFTLYLALLINLRSLSLGLLLATHLLCSLAMLTLYTYLRPFTKSTTRRIYTQFLLANLSLALAMGLDLLIYQPAFLRSDFLQLAFLTYCLLRTLY